MTVINPHNMTRYYVLWGISLSVMAGLAAVLYIVQPTAVFVDVTIPAVFKPIVAACAGVLGLLAVSFKYVFAQELVAWTLLELIGVLGTILAGVFGYSEWWLIYHAVAFSGLLILGPYLQFD
ncbi:MAG: hypothetical protein ACD_41C00232G0003 [uncultured bacterium]|nr:MAG: hypothetical protein ACD_41C00232G0003 [uncultured bacterium]HBY73104.1 hypothetical protein [Candidatus Kerfeldbacteria bacterium]